jgi:hypothetical protein
MQQRIFFFKDLNCWEIKQLKKWLPELKRARELEKCGKFKKWDTRLYALHNKGLLKMILYSVIFKNMTLKNFLIIFN